MNTNRSRKTRSLRPHTTLTAVATLISVAVLTACGSSGGSSTGSSNGSAAKPLDGKRLGVSV